MPSILNVISTIILAIALMLHVLLSHGCTITPKLEPLPRWLSYDCFNGTTYLTSGVGSISPVFYNGKLVPCKLDTK